MNILDLLAQKARVAGLVAAACAVTGVATAAAVSPMSFSPVDSATDVVATPSPTDSAPPSPTDSPSAEPDATESPVTDPSATPEPTVSAEPSAVPGASGSPVPCPTDLPNHGAYVSSVAHDKSTSGRDHGKAVSEAAHSSCGKEGKDGTEPAETESPEPVTSDSPDASPSTHSQTKSHGKGHGKAKKHSHG
jgi:hypothetical protein